MAPALVILAGTLLTLLAAYDAHRPRGVYWSRTDVQFLLPTSSVNPNVIKASSQSVVMTAGAVARIVDPSGGKARLADQDVTLASEGLRHGWAVTLPNSGSQFTSSFSDPFVQVEVVGTTPGEVLASMSSVLRRVAAALSALQHAVPSYNRLSTLLSPAVPVVSLQPNRPARAVLAVLALGAGLTTLAASWLRRAGARRVAVR